jgi:alanyl-tRNA synthetase
MPIDFLTKLNKITDSNKVNWSNRMAKTKWLQVPVDEQDKRKLRKVAEILKRSNADTVRVLIDEAYQKLIVAPKNSDGQAQPQAAAEVPALVAA